jgi:hypothetical protein
MLADLRERVRGLNPNRGNAIKVSELIGHAKALHAGRDPSSRRNVQSIRP